jgi:hypothetical protein
MSSTGKLLYWPGRRRHPDELSALLHRLGASGWHPTRLEPVYDHGPPPGDPGYLLPREVGGDPSQSRRWWMGLSLGAAVALILAGHVRPGQRPQRLTLINPFADRGRLAAEIGFEPEHGWDLVPMAHRPHSEILVDLVLSDSDEKIPRIHSELLREALRPARPRIITIDADHAITAAAAQDRLAGLLLEDS